MPGIKEGIKHEQYKWDAIWLAFTIACHSWPSVRCGTLLEALKRKVKRDRSKGALTPTERRRISAIDFSQSNIGKAMAAVGLEPTADNYSKLRMACKRAMEAGDAQECQTAPTQEV